MRTPIISAALALLLIACGDDTPTNPGNEVHEEVIFTRVIDDSTAVFAVTSDGMVRRFIVPDAIVAGVASGRMLWLRGDTARVTDLKGAGGVAIRLSEPGLPVLAPDGSRFAYVSTAQGIERAELRVALSSGANDWSIRSGVDAEALPAWSPDSRMIAFHRADEALCVVDVASGDVRALDTLAFGHNDGYGRIAWSPDGRFLAYTARREPGVFTTDLFTIGVDGTGRLRLTDDDLVELEPQFMPDGGAIVFVREVGGSLRLALFNRIGSSITDLTSVPGATANDVHPRVSPDGRRVVYVRYNGDPDRAPAALAVLDLSTRATVTIADPVAAWAFWSTE